MKKISLFTCLLCISLMGFSQDLKNKKAEHPEVKRLELINAGMALSPVQMEKWNKVRSKYHAQIQELENSNNPERLKDINQAMRMEYDAILTPEQKGKLKEIEAKKFKPL